MLLHLGANISILKKDVIAIFDYEATKSGSTKDFVQAHSKAGQSLEIGSVDNSKSVVVARDRIYFSPISPVTLQRRSDSPHII